MNQVILVICEGIAYENNSHQQNVDSKYYR